jgi:hypothetical protein
MKNVINSDLQKQVLIKLSLSLVLSIDEKKYWHPKVLKMNRKQLEEFKLILDQETEGITKIVDKALVNDTTGMVQECINNYDTVVEKEIKTLMDQSSK